MRIAPALLAIALVLVHQAGCAPRRPATVAAPEGQAMKIELLGFPGCPNTPAMRDNLRAALQCMGGGMTFTDTNQESLPEGDMRRGWPTPTVLVNGADLFGMAPPSAPSMGCRMYVGGVPDAESIAAKLKALGSAK